MRVGRGTSDSQPRQANATTILTRARSCNSALEVQKVDRQPRIYTRVTGHEHARTTLRTQCRSLALSSARGWSATGCVPGAERLAGDGRKSQKSAHGFPEITTVGLQRNRINSSPAVDLRRSTRPKGGVGLRNGRTRGPESALSERLRAGRDAPRNRAKFRHRLSLPMPWIACGGATGRFAWRHEGEYDHPVRRSSYPAREVTSN
jgi:hypothetical protein